MIFFQVDSVLWKCCSVHFEILICYMILNNGLWIRNVASTDVLMYLLRPLPVCLWKLKLSHFCGVLWSFIPSLFLPLGKTRLFLLLSFFCIIQLASHLSPYLFLSFPQANLKKFMEYVQQRNVEKVSKFLEKGLDPNFHDPETGGKWHHLYSKVQIN